MNQDKIIIASILVALFTIAQVSSSPVQVNSGPNEIFMPPICEPGIIDDMPPHIRKVCMALENSNKLSFALNQYIKNEASGELKTLKKFFIVKLIFPFN